MRPDAPEPTNPVDPAVCDAVSDRTRARGGDAEGGGRVALGQLSDPCTSADLAAALGKNDRSPAAHVPEKSMADEGGRQSPGCQKRLRIADFVEPRLSGDPPCQRCPAEGLPARCS